MEIAFHAASKPRSLKAPFVPCWAIWANTAIGLGTLGVRYGQPPAPWRRPSLAESSVSVVTTDCQGERKVVEATSDGSGRFELTGLAPGTASAHLISSPVGGHPIHVATLAGRREFDTP